MQRQAGFTAAGDRLGASQSTISLRLRRLEDALGAQLLRRSPRHVALTPFGERFLGAARRLIEASDVAAAMARSEPRRRRVALGVSDHAAGDRLPALLAWLTAATPEIAWSVRVGESDRLAAAVQEGALDLAIIRRDARTPAEAPTMFDDALEWVGCGAERFAPISADRPAPLIALAGSCRLRALSVELLEQAGLPWRVALEAEGVAAVQASIRAGLGVAAARSAQSAQRGAAGGRVAGPAAAAALGDGAALASDRRRGAAGGRGGAGGF